MRCPCCLFALVKFAFALREAFFALSQLLLPAVVTRRGIGRARWCGSSRIALAGTAVSAWTAVGTAPAILPAAAPTFGATSTTGTLGERLTDILTRGCTSAREVGKDPQGIFVFTTELAEGGVDAGILDDSVHGAALVGKYQGDNEPATAGTCGPAGAVGVVLEVVWWI